MEQKKSLIDSLSSVSDEELMAAAKGAPIPVGHLRRTTAFDGFFQWLDEFDVKRGRVRVRIHGLYRIYKKFAKTDYILSKPAFGTLIMQVTQPGKYPGVVLINAKSRICQRAFRHAFVFSTNRTLNRHTKRSFYYFCRDYQLTEGQEAIPDFALYHLYDKWCYKRKRVPVEPFKFMLMLHGRFKKRKMFNGGEQYFLSKDIYNHLSLSTIENLRNAKEKKTKARPKRVAFARKNLRIRRDEIEVDYLDKLSKKEKEWLAKFNAESVNADFRHSKPLHNTKKLKKECMDRNNRRNGDILAVAKSQNMLEEVKPHMRYYTPNEYALIRIIEERDELLKEIKNCEDAGARTRKNRKKAKKLSKKV